MDTQTNIRTDFSNRPLDFLALPDIRIPIRANRTDYGFDFDEQELASGQRAASAGLSSQEVSQPAAEEFERAYQWFLS